MVSAAEREILRLHFPMKHVFLNAQADPALLKAWNEAAEAVLSRLDQGQDPEGAIFAVVGKRAK